MNNEFGSTLALLRKQRGLSQKKVAEDLGISQGLLSHYEKGIRECSLAFLVKVAEYFDVSTDYLLGVILTPNPANIADNQINFSDNAGNNVTNTYYLINRKLIIDTVTIIYNILEEIDSKKMNKYVSDYIMTTLYYIFRKIYSINTNNENMFNIHTAIENYCKACTELDIAKIERIRDDLKSKMKNEFSPEFISKNYSEIYSSLMGVIRNTEKNINSKFKI